MDKDEFVSLEIWFCFVFFGGFCVFGFVLVFFFSLKASEVYVSALMV